MNVGDVVQYWTTLGLLFVVCLAWTDVATAKTETGRLKAVRVVPYRLGLLRRRSQTGSTSSDANSLPDFRNRKQRKDVVDTAKYPPTNRQALNAVDNDVDKLLPVIALLKSTSKKAKRRPKKGDSKRTLDELDKMPTSNRKSRDVKRRRRKLRSSSFPVSQPTNRKSANVEGRQADEYYANSNADEYYDNYHSESYPKYPEPSYHETAYPDYTESGQTYNEDHHAGGGTGEYSQDPYYDDFSYYESDNYVAASDHQSYYQPADHHNSYAGGEQSNQQGHGGAYEEDDSYQKYPTESYEDGNDGYYPEESYPQQAYEPEYDPPQPYQPSYEQPSYHPPSYQPDYQPTYSPQIYPDKEPEIYVPEYKPEGYPAPTYPQSHDAKYEDTDYHSSYEEECPRSPDKFCYEKEAGHYGHPDSEYCFIQCDHFGHAFAKLCAYGTSWKGHEGPGPAYANMCT